MSAGSTTTASSSPYADSSASSISTCRVIPETISIRTIPDARACATRRPAVARLTPRWRAISSCVLPSA
ncbi:hypothetical protein BJF90_21300 [Pseudonocardia sp. CNS-004]|nr:hypothetical protein BJF90_21300 [Pseudonocardia sp. CNS-004]